MADICRRIIRIRHTESGMKFHYVPEGSVDNKTDIIDSDGGLEHIRRQIIS